MLFRIFRHHGTPANIIARRLIHYQRDTYLLPLIAAAANQVPFTSLIFLLPSPYPVRWMRGLTQMIDYNTSFYQYGTALYIQPMSLGSGGRIQGFDFDTVEKDLMEMLLANSSPLALQCAQFSYAGEIRKSGGLRRLGAKIPQKNLADALIEQVSRLSLIEDWMHDA
jgi:hypothetical protein